MITQKTLTQIIEEDGSIFLDQDIFNPNYLPDIYQYRDSQLREMITQCKGIDKGKIPSNMFLNGGYATGKTSSVKKFFNLLETAYTNVVCVHINCQYLNTEYKVLNKIYEKLCNEKQKGMGLSTHNIYEKIANTLIEKDKTLIVCLDDFDSIKTRLELNTTMYNLLRAYETFSNVRISVITVSSSNGKILKLDPNVTTIYHPTEIRFPNYTIDQIFTILKQRCRLGFQNGVITDFLIMGVAERSYNRGDLRYGIKSLSKAGIKAESEGSKVILEKHL